MKTIKKGLRVGAGSQIGGCCSDPERENSGLDQGDGGRETESNQVWVSLKAKPIKYAVSCRSSCSNVVSIHHPTWAGLVHFPDSCTPVAHLLHKVSFPVTSPVASPEWGEHAPCPSDVPHGAWSQHACLVCSSRVTFPQWYFLISQAKRPYWSHSLALQAVLGVSYRGTTQRQPPQESLKYRGQNVKTVWCSHL